jgi:glucokinase
MDKYIIGIDVGGTSIKAGVVTMQGNIVGTLNVPTNSGKQAEIIVEETCSGLTTMLQKKKIIRNDVMGIGIGTPGALDLEKGIILKSPNLPSWDGFKIRDTFSEGMGGLPAALDNDANAAALGEFYFGAGKDCLNLIVLTLGTGLGGGVIVNGEILHGNNGIAGELGHITVDANDDFRCGCGNTGCFEGYVGVKGIIRRANEALHTFTTSSLKEYQPELTPKIIYEEALKGDTCAIKILSDTGRYLGIAIASYINIFNPARIILTGGVANSQEFFMPALKQEIAKRAFPTGVDNVEIIISKRVETAGILGAASVYLAKEDKQFSKDINRIHIKSNESQYILSLHIGATGTQSAIIKTQGEKIPIVREISCSPQGTTRAEIIDIAYKQALKTLETSGIERSLILGTGISTPGQVDVAQKIIYSSPHLEWAKVKIYDEFEGLPNPILIDNDADASALAELLFGRGKNTDNFLCLIICTGIGAGLVIDRKIYRGFKGLAGEVGHQSINFEGDTCQCGNTGCLEVYASGRSLVEKMKAYILGGEKTSLIPKINNLNYLDICNAAEEGDQLSISLLKDMGKYLGIGIANILNIISPDKLIISGRLSRAYQFFKDQITTEIKARAFPLVAEKILSLELSNFGDDVDLISAAATFLYQYHEKLIDRS